MSNKSNTPSTIAAPMSKRTTAAIELYRRAYILQGNVLEFVDTFSKSEYDERMQPERQEIEEMACELAKAIRDFIGQSVVYDQEEQLDNTASDLLDHINQ